MCRRIKKIKAPIGDENEMNIRGWYVDSKIKKIKAPIGDENGNQIENKSKRRKIKKIKAPIGDENLFQKCLFLASSLLD